MFPRVRGGGCATGNVALAALGANGCMENNCGGRRHPLALRLLLVVPHMFLFVGTDSTGGQFRRDVRRGLERYGRIIRPILIRPGRSGLALLRPDSRFLCRSRRARY